jgi:hypothetical protein
MKKVLAAACALAPLFAASAAQSRVTEIKIDAVEPFADNHAFGQVGGYVRIKGVVKGELDPKAAENATIVDLDKAPRNARGMVEYETDIFIMRPADPAKGNGILYYEVLNRGNKQLGRRLHDTRGGGESSGNDPKTVADAGNAFLFERGYTVVWSGWEELGRREGIMSARLPAILEDGKPLVRRIREEIQVGKRGPADVEVKRLAYAAASTDAAKARLTERVRESDPRAELPSSAWEFADPRSIRLLPKGAKFAPFTIYDLWYEATGAKVVGVGFAATRDLISFLRNDRADDKGTANPLIAAGQGGATGGIRHTMSFGGSQAGRYLRHFIEMGMNKDLAGRRVFDGVYSHTAGAGKVFANHTFGQSGRTAASTKIAFTPRTGSRSAPLATDPFSARPLLLRAMPATLHHRVDHLDRILAEGRFAAHHRSVRHARPRAAGELARVPDFRHPARRRLRSAGAEGRLRQSEQPTQPDAGDARARRQSRRLADQGNRPARKPRAVDPAVTAVEFRGQDAKARGFALAPAANRIGPRSTGSDRPAALHRCLRAMSQPAREVVRNAYRRSMPTAMVAGLRLPDIVAALATYTGWNVYDSAKTELCDRDGSYVAFAKTKAEREAAGIHACRSKKATARAQPLWPS